MDRIGTRLNHWINGCLHCDPERVGADGRMDDTIGFRLKTEVEGC